MRRDEFKTLLSDQLEPVHVSALLRRRCLNAAQSGGADGRLDGMDGKEGTVVKRKFSVALACALMLALLGGVALAAANRAGLLDFIGRYQGAYIPEDAAQYVEAGDNFDTDVATVALREVYYDGRSLRLVADVTPSDPKTLLAGVDSMAGDSWEDLTRLVGAETDEGDERTIADAFREMGYTAAYNVNLSSDAWARQEENGESGSIVEATQDFVLGEDGTLTVFSSFEFTKDEPERDINLILIYSRMQTDESGNLTDEREQPPLKCLYPLHLTAAEKEESGVYVSAAPADFESIGVRVDRLTVTVKPLELYYTIEGTITDAELYKKTDDGLLFEFIDPEKQTDEPWGQRLSDGLNGAGGGVFPDGKERFLCEGTLGANELRDVYTLRAYECWNKQRFDTLEIEMRPATTAEVAEISASVAALWDEATGGEEEDGSDS